MKSKNYESVRNSVAAALAAILLIAICLSGCGANEPKPQEGGTLGTITIQLEKAPGGESCATFTATNEVSGAKFASSFILGGLNQVINRVPAGSLKTTLNVFSGELIAGECSGQRAYSGEDEGYLPPGGSLQQYYYLKAVAGSVTVDGEYEEIGAPSTCQRSKATIPTVAQHGMVRVGGELILAHSGSRGLDLYAIDPTMGDAEMFEVKEQPSSRTNFVLEYDERNNKLILFGGDDGRKPLDHLIEFILEDCVWSDRTPPDRTTANWPSPRWGAAADYDHTTQTVLITGGIEINLSSWTWERDAADASVYSWDSAEGAFNVYPALGDAPSPRGGSSLVSDRTRQKLYLTMGNQQGYGQDDNVYVFDLEQAEWSVLGLTQNPEPRQFAAMWQRRDGRIVMTGGSWYDWLPTRDFFVFDPVTGAVEIVYDDSYHAYWAPVAHDPTSDFAYMFGGYYTENGGPAPLGSVLRRYSPTGEVTLVGAE